VIPFVEVVGKTIGDEPAQMGAIGAKFGTLLEPIIIVIESETAH